MRVSVVTGLARGTEVWLHGSQGTLHIDPQMNIFGGQRGDGQLCRDSKPDLRGQYGWRVEEEFISAIRGLEPVTHTPFDIGRALHGVHRGGNPQRPDRPGDSPATLAA